MTGECMLHDQARENVYILPFSVTTAGRPLLTIERDPHTHTTHTHTHKHTHTHTHTHMPSDTKHARLVIRARTQA